MYDDVSFVVRDIVVGWGKVECLVEKVLADGGVEFYDVEANKAVMLFVFNSFKPFDHGGGVFLLVEFGCSRDFAVDSVEGYFADFAYLGFSRVD